VKDYLRFDVPTESNHSMANALPTYVCGKIPCPEVEAIVRNGGKIKVLGLPPEILKFCKEKLKFRAFEPNEISKQKPGKKENIYRPVFYTTSEPIKNMVVSVMSGSDYLQQVAALLAYQVEHKIGADPIKTIEVTEFPDLEGSFPFWTDLSSFVRPNDTVLIGNVASFSSYIRDNGGFSFIDEKENYFYKSTRVWFGTRVLNFLMVKHTFWGNMSALLAETILKQSVFELIYMSKVATLKDANDIYQKSYAPSRFVLLRDGHIEKLSDIKNYIAEYYPDLNSGLHLSVATVMEEDVNMTRLAKSLGAKSLDLELSHIVKAIQKSNKALARKTRFGSVHIVTDYLRDEGEQSKEINFDLSNSRSQEASALKKKSWDQIYVLLSKYLGAKPEGIKSTQNHAKLPPR